MSNYNDNPVPKGPPDLCFDSGSFTKESFSVDEFLQEHRNRANLETMRDDLGLYLKVLRSAMIDLINKDYADFVNLSSNLIGLDKAINDIQLPLGQLREELLEVRQSLDGAASEVSLQLGLRRDLRERKRCLLSLNRVQTSLKKLKMLLAPADDTHHLELKVLERVVAEFIHLQFHMSRCLRDISEKDSQVFEKLGEALLRCVDRMFLDALSKEESGKQLLLKTLCLYQSLDKLSNAEGLYRKKIVSRALESVITEDFLRSSSQGLPGLYKKILSYVDTDMKCIREVEKAYNQNSDKNKCDFFLRSFWPEVEERLEMNLTSIFSPGDPEVFYKRYTDSLKFLEALLNLNSSEKSVQELQSHPNFISFMDRWDLPVYFQIRFQEIVRNLEAAFEAENWKSNSGKWKLVASETAWNSLNKCWEDGVFLTAIAHKFWKLSLQIISRYTTWTRTVIHSNSVQNQSEVNFLVFLHTDIEVFLSSFEDFKKSVIKKLPEISEHTVELLEGSWRECCEGLGAELDKVSGGIVRRLSGDSTSLVRQVNDIPRVYRRTNREPPTKPCAYISHLLALPASFYKMHHTHPKANLWLQTMFSTVTKQYYTSVAEVLDSVQKTEESLRRLKKARDRASNLVPNDRRVEDDNKIRLQLLLDVNAFVKGIEEFGLKKEKIEKLDDLLLLVEATQKS